MNLTQGKERVLHLLTCTIWWSWSLFIVDSQRTITLSINHIPIKYDFAFFWVIQEGQAGRAHLCGNLLMFQTKPALFCKTLNLVQGLGTDDWIIISDFTEKHNDLKNQIRWGANFCLVGKIGRTYRPSLVCHELPSHSDPIWGLSLPFPWGGLFWRVICLQSWMMLTEVKALNWREVRS